MNNLKKTVFALGLGILAFGFSAFKTKEKSSVYIYYKVNYSTYPAANNPNGYVYYSADHCEAGGTLCSAQWDIGSLPAPLDGAPLPTIDVSFVTNSVVAGHFE